MSFGWRACRPTTEAPRRGRSATTRAVRRRAAASSTASLWPRKHQTTASSASTACRRQGDGDRAEIQARTTADPPRHRAVCPGSDPVAARGTGSPRQAPAARFVTWPHHAITAGPSTTQGSLTLHGPPPITMPDQQVVPVQRLQVRRRLVRTPAYVALVEPGAAQDRGVLVVGGASWARMPRNRKTRSRLDRPARSMSTRPRRRYPPCLAGVGAGGRRGRQRHRAPGEPRGTVHQTLVLDEVLRGAGCREPR